MKEVKPQKSMRPIRSMITMLLVVIAWSQLFAQTKTITGVIKDASGETIIGASVKVKGTTIGTITDFDGKYKINVPATAKSLEISYVGMEKREIPINGTVINATLQANNKALDEVVVIGYGTQKKKDLTGSVSSVSEKVLKDIPVTSVAEALTGKLAGVQVTTTEGSPDAEIKIRVRGGGSITQSNSPLYIVDGFARDDIKDISVSEIQSIDVLKDASSTAIYGSRGANGVIIVTTKSAQSGKVSVSYTGFMGVKSTPNMFDVLSPFEFAQKQYERAVWGSTVASDYENYFGSYDDIDLYKSVKGTNWQKETFGRTGVTQNHTLNLSGGNKKFSYTANYSHIYDKAIMYMSDYTRDNAGVKLQYNPTNWLKMNLAGRFAGTTINGSGANDQTGTEKSTSDSRVKNAVVYSPIHIKNQTAQDDDVESLANLYSPLVATEDNNRLQNNKDMSVNGGFTLNLIKNLSFTSTIGYIQNKKDDKRFFGLTSYYVTNGGALKRDNHAAPATFLTNSTIGIFQNTNVINYKKDNLFKGQNISVVLGQETYIKSNKYTFQDLEAFTNTYKSQDVWANLSDGTNVSTINFVNPDERLFSYFGRFNYDIKDRYLLAASLRADGSSKFSNGNEWGYFPSVSAGWRISEEPWMRWSNDWLSNFKFRGSYGEAGNNNIPNSAFKRVYSASHSNYLPTSIFPDIYTAGNVLANPDLKWETTITKNLGVDFGFFKNRINGSFEVYRNRTEDVLIAMNVSGVGYTSQWQNAATTENKGAELTINADLAKSKDFELGVTFNISANQNNVVSLGSLTSYPFNEAWTSFSEASNSYNVMPGNPVGLIYGFVNDGMYQSDDFKWNGSKWLVNESKYTTKTNVGTVDKPVYRYYDANGVELVDNSSITGLSWGPGAMKLKDINGDGKITIEDKALIGNTNPKHFGSFSINSRYKGFDANVNFNWVYGNDIYNATKIELSTQYYKFRNMLASDETSYTQIDWATGNHITDPAKLDAANAGATMWAAPTGRPATTSWAIEDGSFLRLSNITLGYTVPTKVTKKFYVQKLRIYATAFNIYTWTKYTGFDPEVDTRRSTPATPGVDYSAYPKSRSFNIGANVTF